MEHLVVYFSPAGSTRLVARTIEKRLAFHGHSAAIIDLGKPFMPVRDRAAGCPESCCLWIGSPVYCDHAAPPVEAFIDALPAGIRGYSAPFVTWGGVCSGLALPEMAAHLEQRGLRVVAAAKVMAAHSSTWADSPLWADRPDSSDLEQIERLVDAVVGKLADASVAALAPEVLDYQSAEQRAASAAISLAVAKAHMPPLAVREESCTQCGECVEGCPTGAMTLDPYPVIGPECVLCMQCVRNCPQAAFPHDGKAVGVRIAAKAQACPEPKETGIFI